MTGGSPIDATRQAGWLAALVGIMVFLCVLAVAAGIGLVGAAGDVGRQMAGRATVLLVTADPAERDRQTAALLAAIDPAARARVVPDAEVAALVEPWLGTAAAQIPLPRLLDAEPGEAGMAALAATVARVAPDARVDGHVRWLGPVHRLIDALAWLSGALGLLAVAAMAAAVVLAARGALAGDRATVELLHMLGASDGQIASMFQRRFARQALAGGAVGLLAGCGVLLLVGSLAAALGSELAVAPVPALLFPALVLVPVAATAVATLAARRTILAALRSMP